MATTKPWTRRPRAGRPMGCHPFSPSISAQFGQKLPDSRRRTRRPTQDDSTRAAAAADRNGARAGATPTSIRASRRQGSEHRPPRAGLAYRPARQTAAPHGGGVQRYVVSPTLPVARGAASRSQLLGCRCNLFRDRIMWSNMRRREGADGHAAHRAKPTDMA
jgi:hypothetical protein